MVPPPSASSINLLLFFTQNKLIQNHYKIIATHDLHNAGNKINIAPSNMQSTPNNNQTSSFIAVSVRILTLTAVIFSSNNTMGRTRGRANIDISVAFPLSLVDITETNVKTMFIPNMPNADDVKNNVASFTGKPVNRAKKARIIRKRENKKTKL